MPSHAGQPDELAHDFVTKLTAMSDPTSGYVANHKIYCKNYLSYYGIPLAGTYLTIENVPELKRLDWDRSLPSSFVMKGALSNVGNTVRIVKARSGQDFVLEDGNNITRTELVTFAEKILKGGFLGTQDATEPILFEEKLESCAELKPYLKCGLADLRIGYYKLVPIHIRLRVASTMSGGLSNVCKNTEILSPLVNIHGITTRTGLFPIEITSETGQDILGIKVPFFEESLRLGATIEHLMRLNHTTLDIALTNRGPVFIEMHTGTNDWAKEVDLRFLVNRIWAVEKNIERVRDVESALALAREIYTVDERLDFAEFSRDFRARTGIEVSTILPI